MRRPIFIPLSGRDRRFAIRELKAAKGYYEMRMRDAAVAQVMADAAQRRADRYFCEAFNAAAFSGESIQPSPTVQQALNAGFNMLEIRCGRCWRQKAVDLSTIRCLRETALWILEARFSCHACAAKTGWRSQAFIVGLRPGAPPEPEPPAEPPAAHKQSVA